jgi:predicted oxidoreductase
MAAQPARSPPFRACDSAAGFDTRHCHGQVRRFGVTALMDVFRTLVERVIRSDITDAGAVAQYNSCAKH